VNSVYDKRKYLISFSVISVVLIVWLTTSFWWNAYVQRSDARQVQALSSIEDKLFVLANKLSKERKYLLDLLSIDVAEAQTQQQYAKAIQESDNAFQEALQTMSTASVSLVPGLLGNQISHNIGLSSATLKELQVGLLSHRHAFKGHSTDAMNPLQSDTAVGHFDRYSNLINAIGTVRRDVQSATTIDNQEVQYHARFIDSIWVLKEANLQIASLLENILVNAEHGNKGFDAQSHHVLLQKLNYRTALAFEEISLLGRRYQFSDSIEQKMERVNRLLYGDVATADLKRWVNSANELHALALDLRSDSTNHILAEISGVEKKATTNLVIDSFLLLLCAAMILFSFRYFKRLHHLANHDELTGLSNRRSFSVVAESMMESVNVANQNLAILMIDLDKFKYINDSMGHTVGDQLLQAFSKRLVSFCRHENHLARIGGDEFSVMKKYTHTSELESFAESLSAHLREPYSIDRGFLQIGASIGVSHYPAHASDVSELMKNADLAMYCAKAQGRSKIMTFNADLRADYEHKVRVETDLQLALRDKQFELYYQPKFNIAAGSIDSVEALIRWNHPDRGMIPPDHFIPVAEECGLLQQMGMWVLKEACRQAAEWVQTGEHPLRVAVNVSADQFLQPDFVSDVRDCLKHYNLPAQYLELELTESVVMNDVDLVVQSLSALRDAGIKIALDDFGTGYSSLSYLQNLPIDTLKIDKSFIQTMEIDNDHQSSIAQTVAVLAESLELDTVAEGVETDDQLNAVVSMGISAVQGYYYSKPLGATELQKTVAEINQITNNQKPAA